MELSRPEIVQSGFSKEFVNTQGKQGWKSGHCERDGGLF
jgi:hypothetical protein